VITDKYREAICTELKICNSKLEHRYFNVKFIIYLHKSLMLLVDVPVSWLMHDINFSPN
jgi:hypothetical protein